MCARSLSPFVVVLIAVGLVSGQEDDKQSKVDPAGTWKWEREVNENKIDYTLKLKRANEKLTGTYKTVLRTEGLD